MQELALSNNLEILTDEILSFGQHINKSYWEIGRRLNYIKENDLVHGQFLNYLEKIKIQRDEAYKLMQIATLPNVATLQHLPKTSLFLIATLPEEEKQAQLEKVEQGDNPTVRELKDLKRKLKESEERNKRLAEQALKQEVIEKEVVIEKVPDDYEATKNLNSDLLNKNKHLNYDNENLQRVLKIKEHELKRLEDDSHEAIALKDAVDSLQADKSKLETSIANLMELNSMATEFENFFDTKMAPMRFKTLIQGLGTEIQIDKIRDILTVVDVWLNEMNAIVPEQGRRIIEGEIING